MIKYKVLDRSGKEIKYNQRIPDYTGMWWYFRGCYNKKYLQVVEDEREEKPRAMFASNFHVTIETEAKPDYTKITAQGWKVVNLWSYNEDTHVIVNRGGTHPFAIGKYYNLNTGEWCFGHYDYKTLLDAQKELLRQMYKEYCK